MSREHSPSALERARERFRRIVEEASIRDLEVRVLAKPLTPEEAIGTPGRRDYPILVGKERVLEATVGGRRGQAFTDSARELEGSLAEVLALPLESNQHRAIFTATLNATLAYLGRVQATVHCKDDEPEECALEIADHIRTHHGAVEVGLIGMNPAIAERLVRTFGPDHVRITDLDPDNVGRERFGVTIWNGAEQTEALIERSDLVLLSGTTLVNDTFDAIWNEIEARGKQGLVFGMTASGASELLGFPRICPRAHAG